MKIFLNRYPAVLILVLVFLNTIENCIAQEPPKSALKKNIILHFGYIPGSNNWKYSHPSYSGAGVVQVLEETGSFKSNSIYNGQFELSKGHFGFSAGTGIFPAEIKVDKNEDSFSFNSLFLEIEGGFFPLKNQQVKWSLWLKLVQGV
jgi:hypothetical protein